MIIILEGPDGAGKTTLAKQLCARYGVRYEHEGPPPNASARDVLRHYGLKLDEARRRNDHVVFDRLWVGERIYGPILRGANLLENTGPILRRLTLAVGARHVLCLPPFKVAREAFLADPGPLYQDPTKYDEVYQAYDATKRMFDLWTYSPYDWTAQHALRNLFEHLDKPRPSLQPGYTGSPWAHYLIVGDRGSDPTNPVDVPWFGTTGSGPYVTEALHRAGFDEAELAFVNAWGNGPNGKTVSLDEHQLGVTIALGSEADKRCRFVGVPRRSRYHVVPHPQYWKRFRHHDIAEYAQMLRNCR